MQQCVHRLRQNPHLGFNAKVERLQQGQTTRQSPSFKGILLLKRKPHGGVIAIGNALGNSIVSNRINAEQIKQNAMLASDALSQQRNVTLNQQLDVELQQRAGVIANDVGTRSAADGAAGFDANVLAQLNASDLMQNQYLDRRAGAIDGYLNISRKTQRDIQSIDTRTASSRQQRATQAAQIQQRYEKRTMDFRMDNPVYRTPEPAYNWDNLLENAKETRMRSLGTSLYIDRRVTPQEQYFQETGQLDELYYSRAQKHDPVANVGLGVWGSLEQNIDVHGVAGGLYWKGVGALTTFNSKMALATGRLTDTLVSAVVKGGPNQNAGVSLLNQVFNNDEIDRLNVQMANDVAKSHLQAVSRDFQYDTQGVKGLLSESQITRYHHDVFKSYDASIRYYGGTLGIGDSQGPVSDVIRRGLGVFYLYPAGDR